MKHNFMPRSLFDRHGVRKYLVAKERRAFLAVAQKRDPDILSFCFVLAISGARISEVLALTGDKIDYADTAIIFETLKRRQRGIYRAVPVPAWLLERLPRKLRKERLWTFGRTTAWKRVKEVLKEAGIVGETNMPKALRHAFAVEGVTHSVPLHMIQKWMGHARIETTAIYANVIGEEERQLAERTWDMSLKG